ncbi:putative T7SS-secreted protein [Kitasatospora phosalacinea]|uniref:putative T7SS-secreted protein n=1 Tax=Kitasatospora phosalacinea TaxID=2065 RepID=UPI0036623D67
MSGDFFSYGLGFDQDFPALGFNPAPGNPGNVDGLVGKLNKAANAMDNAHRTLVEVGRGGSLWEGDAAQAFSGKIGELPGYLADSVDAMRQASSALNSWRGQLSSYQDTAKRYEEEAQNAKSRLDSAKKTREQASDRYDKASDSPAFKLIGMHFDDQATFSQAQNQIDSASAEYQAAGDALEAASRDLQSIKDELEAIVKQARELYFHHQDDAGRTAKALRRANQNAPDISAWEKIGNKFKDIGKSIKKWATDHADVLKKIGDIAGGVSSVLAIAALATMWCPPLSAGLGVASAGASAVALGAHGMAKLGGADVSWGTIALDGVGAIPFGGTAFKGAKGAVKGVVGLAKGERLAVAGADLARVGSKLSDDVARGAGSLMNNKILTPIFTKTPLRSLPGLTTKLDDAGKVILDPRGWYSRGTQIGTKIIGLGINAPNLYHQVTGS